MTEAEFQALSPDQQKQFLAETMEEVHKTYKENPLVTEDLLLRKITDAISSKGFNFFPHEVCKQIDAEASRQFNALIADMIKGVPPAKLNSMKTEVIKWYNEEEVRFEAYKHNFLENAKGPQLSDVAPVFIHKEDKSASSSQIDVDVKEVTDIYSKEQQKQVPGYDPGHQYPNVVDEHAGEAFDPEPTASVTPITKGKKRK